MLPGADQGYGFDDESGLVPTYYPDMAEEIDGTERDAKAELFAFFGGLLREIKRFELFGESGCGKIKIEQVARRSVATAYAACPDILEGKSLAHLGRGMECTSANLSKIMLQFSDRYGVAPLLGKAATQREVYSLNKTVRAKLVRSLKKHGRLTTRQMVQRRYFTTSLLAAEWCETQVKAGLLCRLDFKPLTGRPTQFFQLV
jgi:hypothetical protein